MNNKQKLMIFVSFALLIMLGVRSVNAYFYTYVSAEGTMPIYLYDESEITESVPDVGIKSLTIQSTGEDPIFVRVRAIAPSEVTVSLNEEMTGWSLKGDYYEYAEKIDSGKDVTVIFDVDLGDSAKDGEIYNVALVYEATPAHYSDDKGWYCDWNDVIPPGEAIVVEGGN